MGRYLIINADDFGLCTSVNEAIYKLLKENKISSATIMPVGCEYDDAVRWCIENNIESIGIHLTFTSELVKKRYSSLTKGKSLEDNEGYLYKDCNSFNVYAQGDEVNSEIEAQFRKVMDSGLKISHVDNHMESLYGIHVGPSYFPIIFQLCHKYGKKPFRMFKKICATDTIYQDAYSTKSKLYFSNVIRYAEILDISTPDYLLSYPYKLINGENYESFKSEILKKLYNLPQGISEITFHPSIANAEIKNINPHWQKRVWEYVLLNDDEFWDVIKEENIKVISYKDIDRYSIKEIIK